MGLANNNPHFVHSLIHCHYHGKAEVAAEAKYKRHTDKEIRANQESSKQSGLFRRGRLLRHWRVERGEMDRKGDWVAGWNYEGAGWGWDYEDAGFWACICWRDSVNTARMCDHSGV